MCEKLAKKQREREEKEKKRKDMSVLGPKYRHKVQFATIKAPK